MNKEKLLKLSERNSFKKFREILIKELKEAMISNAPDKKETIKFLRDIIQDFDCVGSAGPWKKVVRGYLK